MMVVSLRAVAISAQASRRLPDLTVVTMSTHGDVGRLYAPTGAQTYKDPGSSEICWVCIPGYP